MADNQAPVPAPGGNQGVQLGIGTLIIIAIIVSMCSGSGEVQKLRGDANELKQQVREINRKLDALLAKDAPPPAVEAPADSAASPEAPAK
jgi:outer membrane murein-binding lipoprotein Lpp